MRNPTQKMTEILKSPEARKMIDYVSPIYQEAYVGLFLFQVIGSALDSLDEFSEELKDQLALQTVNREWAIRYWEDQYKVYPDKGWNFEQRRSHLLEKTGSHFYNPKKISDIIGTMTGCETEIMENVSKNKFVVFIKGYVRDLTKVYAFIDKIKPAHLIYEIRMSELIEVDVPIHIGVCLSEHEHYVVDVI